MTPTPETLQPESASDTLIRVMEAFGEDEPKEIIIIYTTKSGDLVWSTNAPNDTTKLGLLELTKACILKKALT